MIEARVRARLVAAGWEPGTDGAVERSWPDGTRWRCTVRPASAGRCDLPEALIFEADGDVHVIDVLGHTDLEGMDLDRAGRPTAVLDFLATTTARGNLLRYVLRPLMVHAAVFRQRALLPIGFRGFMREDLPRRPVGPLVPAIAAADGSPGRWLDVAFAALDAHLLHVALAAFDRAVVAGADPGLAELWRGWLLLAGDPAKAAAALERAADGGSAGAAACLLNALRPVDWERATREDPAFVPAWLSRGLALAESGHPEDALRVLDQAASLHPDAQMRYYRGYIRSLLGDDDAALDDLAEAVRLAPWITQEILADPDLYALRDHPRFHELTGRRAALNGQDPQSTDTFRRLATKIADRAPDGWRRAEITAGGGTGGNYILADGSKGGGIRLADLRGGLPFSHGRARVARMAVHASGWFEAAVGGLEEQAGAAWFLDEKALPDDPGDDQDGPADPAQAGDPDEAVRLLRAYLRRRAEILGRAEEPPPPEEDPDEWFNDLDHPLPDDLRALYAVMDGDAGLIDNGYEWLSASGVSELGCDHYWMDHVALLTDPRRTVLEHGPPGAIRRSPTQGAMSTSPSTWTRDRGRPGQVIRIGLRRSQPAYVADSVTSLLRRHVEALDRGDWTLDDGHLRLDLGDMAQEREEDAAPVESTVRGEDAPDPGHDTQLLRVWGGGDIDLGAVGGTRLLQLELSKCRSAGLRPLQDTAIEVLALLNMETVDLAPLAGHPTLRAVTVHVHHAVDLAPLTSVPRLYALELGGSPVLDLAVLGRMSGRLRYLSLRYEQWLELWRQDITLPGLAMAVLSGAPSPSTVAEWARRLPGDGGVRHFIGRY